MSRIRQAATSTLPRMSVLSCAALVVLALVMMPAAVGASWPGVLKRGSVGSEVELVQEMLWTLGYLIGEPDGVYGANTELSVRNFQIANGLLVDGKVGPETFSRLSKEFTARMSYDYTVRRGTAWSIARRFGTTVSALAGINGIDPRILTCWHQAQDPVDIACVRGAARTGALVPWTTAGTYSLSDPSYSDRREPASPLRQCGEAATIMRTQSRSPMRYRDHQADVRRVISWDRRL